MRKLFLFLGVVGLMMTSKAECSGLKAGAYEFFRSTEVSGAISNFQVATGSIYLHGFTVSSGNVNSTFQYRNSSTTATSGSITSRTDVIKSTSVIYQISTGHGDFVYIGDYLSEGFNITTTGTSHLRIFWNWINNVPTGQESRGFRK